MVVRGPYVGNLIFTTGISFVFYSLTDIVCQGIEKKYPVLKIHKKEGEEHHGDAEGAADDFYEVEVEEDKAEWKKPAFDDPDGLLNDDGWPKGRCCEGLERKTRRLCGKFSVKLKIDWIKWEHVLKYNIIGLCVYNPVGYTWYYVMEKLMPGSLIFHNGALWQFFVKWGSSLAAYVLAYKIVEKLEFYRDPELAYKTRFIRKRKPALRLAEFVLMATTTTCNFLFLSEPVWMRTVYVSYEAIDQWLVYFFLYKYESAEAKERALDEDIEDEEYEPYIILKTENSGRRKP